MNRPFYDKPLQYIISDKMQIATSNPAVQVYVDAYYEQEPGAIPGKERNRPGIDTRVKTIERKSRLSVIGLRASRQKAQKCDPVTGNKSIICIEYND